MTPPPDETNTDRQGSAAVVLACTDLAANIEFFEGHGFRLERISPADDPSLAVLRGHGLNIALERAGEDRRGVLRLAPSDCADSGVVVAPNGTRIEFNGAQPDAPTAPIPSDPVLARATERSWQRGRAGMGYRDLIPGRLGGRCIASRIRIEEGGPVPDYVHHHAVHFQFIYCAQGWVRVVYQDQGEPFVLNAGDCVLQPPGIRHRVLESSAGLEVVELASPARHDTLVDHELQLPTERRDERTYGGQRFVCHVAEEADWEVDSSGLRTRDLGLSSATGGTVGAWVVRSDGAGLAIPHRSLGEDHGPLFFLHVLSGAVELEHIGTDSVELRAGDALTLPTDAAATLTSREGLEFLLVRAALDPAD